MPAGLGFLLVALLDIGVLVVRRHLPIWGLLALGLVTSWAMQQISFVLPGELARGLFRIDLPATRKSGIGLIVSPTLQHLIVAIPVWLVTLGLLWNDRRLWRSATWAILLLGLAVVGASILIDVNILLDAGLALLLLRAQTLRGRAIGLLAPALVWGSVRIAVPLLVRPNFHPASTWLGDILLSAFVLFVLALAFYLYSQPHGSSGMAGRRSVYEGQMGT